MITAIVGIIKESAPNIIRHTMDVNNPMSDDIWHSS